MLLPQLGEGASNLPAGNFLGGKIALLGRDVVY